MSECDLDGASAARALPEWISDLSPVRATLRSGALDELGSAAEQLDGVSRVLLVSDAGVRAAGHVERAIDLLVQAGMHVALFDDVCENPTTREVQRGVKQAADDAPDAIVALGGGSVLDCAKGINIIHTNGGAIADYWGVNKTTAPMLPMIAIPTTGGTGSEAQSFALISDPVSHRKMACGDRRLPNEGGLRPHTALLDPDLLSTMPREVGAHTGMDAISHAVETAATNARNDESRRLSVASWQRLAPACRDRANGDDSASVRARLLAGAFLAGAAIERSMLGAAHSCANPLTARYDIIHGQAVGVMLPHVVRDNCRDGANPYADLDDDPERLAAQLTELLTLMGLETRLEALGVELAALDALAAEAVEQWTAQFNPSVVDADAFRRIYEAAL